MKYQNTHKILASAVVIGLLSGCAVGPDYKRPDVPDVSGYTAAPLQARTAEADTAMGESQRFVESDRVAPEWWREFGSPRLDALIDDSLKTNPTLVKAEATLRQAQELYAARAGATLYPQVDANLSAQRQRLNPGTLGQSGEAREFSLYTVGGVGHYAPDPAGGNRRALEALAAKVDYQRYQLDGARLMLVANIVATAISRAGLTVQLHATEDILRAQEEQLDLIRVRVLLGQAAPTDMFALQTRVEQTRAGIPLLRNQLQQNEHLLAVFAGRAPGEGGMPAFTLEEFTLPVELPLIVPSALVRTRPDIQSAEALLHAANAEYGVAVAKLYPQLNLSADLGSQALTIDALFGSGSAVWSLVGQLTQPLLNLGLPAEKRAALAAFDAAAANYQAIVIESLRHVADVLRALENDAQRLAALSAADAAAQESLDAMRRRYELGAAGYEQVLVAKQQSKQIYIDLIAARAQRLVDSTALYQAMGGGGWGGEEANVPSAHR